MFEHTVNFKINDERMPKVKNCSLHIQLNEVLENEIPINPKTFFTNRKTISVAQILLVEIGRKGLMNPNSNRISSKISQELFEIIRDDSSFKALADYLTLEKFYSLTALFRTSYCQPRFNIFLSLHA